MNNANAIPVVAAIICTTENVGRLETRCFVVNHVPAISKTEIKQSAINDLVSKLEILNLPRALVAKQRGQPYTYQLGRIPCDTGKLSVWEHHTPRETKAVTSSGIVEACFIAMGSS